MISSWLLPILLCYWLTVRQWPHLTAITPKLTANHLVISNLECRYILWFLKQIILVDIILEMTNKYLQLPKYFTFMHCCLFKTRLSENSIFLRVENMSARFVRGKYLRRVSAKNIGNFPGGGPRLIIQVGLSRFSIFTYQTID